MDNHHFIPKKYIGRPVAIISASFLIFLLWISPIRADNVISNGTTIRISSGTFINTAKNIVIENGGKLTNEGSLILKSNLTNQNGLDDLGKGTIEFSGNTSQSLSGQNAMGSLVVNNTEGLDIIGNTTINTGLGLQNGHLRLGQYNLTLGSLAVIVGVPSASSMVIATGTGELRKSFSLPGSFTYPVGDNSGIAEYSPVTLKFTNGIFANGNYAGVKLQNSAYPGYPINSMNRYWSLTQNGITGCLYDAVFQYLPADFNGNENEITCTQVEPKPAVSYSPANPTLHQLTAGGLVTFGDFTGLAFSQHFTRVWTGNGVDHMNIHVYSAKLDGVDLAAGDEIGIFDGDICVGVGTLSGPITQQNTLNIVVSRNDGFVNGYTSGDAITYKLFDKSIGLEISHITAIYSNAEASWVTNGKFAVGTSAFTALTGLTSIYQDIPMIAGWNIFSANLIPFNQNMKDIFQPFIDNGKLVKVMDEAGRALEDFGVLGGWNNNIGDLNQTKGYKVLATQPITLSLEGGSIPMPVNIPLMEGWNIISYPCISSQDAKALVQPLIDAGVLRKIMDETGLSLENYGDFGGWTNNIGNFTPGKGFKINVTSPCTLTISSAGTKAATITPEVLSSFHFAKIFDGNGTDHFNIHLMNLEASGLKAGDEIGIFDGKYCVGSATIGADQMIAGTIAIPASSEDGISQSVNGFTAGHPVDLKLFRENHTLKLDQVILKGTNSFEKNGSLFVNVSSKGLPSLLNPGETSQFRCYPNPFKDEITISIYNSKQTDLKVGIYNLLGQRIKDLYKGTNKGELILKWDGTSDSGGQVVSGVYLCKVNGEIKKVVFEGGE